MSIFFGKYSFDLATGLLHCDVCLLFRYALQDLATGLLHCDICLLFRYTLQDLAAGLQHLWVGLPSGRTAFVIILTTGRNCPVVGLPS